MVEMEYDEPFRAQLLGSPDLFPDHRRGLPLGIDPTPAYGQTGDEVAGTEVLLGLNRALNEGAS